jgi:hypothetical protein
MKLFFLREFTKLLNLIGKRYEKDLIAGALGAKKRTSNARAR